MSNSYIKTTAASAIGALIEWYDFFIYGTCAALVFPKLFFSGLPPVVATVVSIASYSIAFLFRPLGGLVVGHYADKIGRKKVLSFTLFLMGACTVGIGLLPTYEQAGVIAPLLLIFLRILQGVAIGGEWGAAAVMVYEHSPYNLKGLFGSTIQMGVPAAILAATGMYTLLTTNLSDEAFWSWGWRIPFLISVVIVIVGSYIRRHLKDPQEFTKIANKQGRAPVREVFAKHKALVLQIAGMRMFQNLIFTFLTVYLLNYINNVLHMPKEWALSATLKAAAISIVVVPIIGLISDVWGRKLPFRIGAIALIVSAIPAVEYVYQGEAAITAVIVAGFIFHDFMFSQQPALIPESFPVEVRVTGSNVSYGLGAAFAGTIMPTLPFVYDRYGNLGIGIALMIVGTISLTCMNAPGIGKYLKS